MNVDLGETIIISGGESTVNIGFGDIIIPGESTGNIWFDMIWPWNGLANTSTGWLWDGDISWPWNGLANTSAWCPGFVVCTVG